MLIWIEQFGGVRALVMCIRRRRRVKGRMMLIKINFWLDMLHYLFYNLYPFLFLFQQTCLAA